MNNFNLILLQFKRLSSINVKVRVDMVRTIHDDLLTQWRHIPVGQFPPIFFWYELLPTIYGSQKFSKIRVLKVNYFHLSQKKNTSNWKFCLILMPLLFFLLIRLEIHFQLSENLQTGFKSFCLVNKSFFTLEYYQNFIIY